MSWHNASRCDGEIICGVERNITPYVEIDIDLILGTACSAHFEELARTCNG